jgi:hypothetical protein
MVAVSYTGGCEISADVAENFPLYGAAEQADKGHYLAAAGELPGKLGKTFGKAVQKSARNFLKANPLPTKAGEIKAKVLPSEGVAVQRRLATYLVRRRSTKSKSMLKITLCKAQNRHTLLTAILCMSRIS